MPRCHSSAPGRSLAFVAARARPRGRAGTSSASVLLPAGWLSRAGHELGISFVCSTRWRRRRTWQNRAPLPLLPAPARCPRPHRWMPPRTPTAQSARTPSATKPAWAGAGTVSVFPAYRSGSAEKPCAQTAVSLFSTSSASWEPKTMRCMTSRTTRERDLDAALQKGGSGGVPQAASTTALPAGTMAVAVPGPQGGTEAGPRGDTTMAADGLSTPGATTPREAGGGGGEGLEMLLVMRAELQGPNGTSQPPQGGANAASGLAGIPPGTGM